MENRGKSNECRKFPNQSQVTYLITLLALITLIFRNSAHSDQYIEMLKNLILLGVPSPLIRKD
jgi:hypothetical protein